MHRLLLLSLLCSCHAPTPNGPAGCHTTDLVISAEVNGRTCNVRWAPEHLPLVLVTAVSAERPAIAQAAGVFNGWLGLEVFTVGDGPGYQVPVEFSDALSQSCRVGQVSLHYTGINATAVGVGIKTGQSAESQMWVLLHELGHVLALEHTDPAGICSVMHSGVRLDCPDLAEEQLLALRSLYNPAAALR